MAHSMSATGHSASLEPNVPAPVANLHYTTRPATPADEDFLLAVYASTRLAELASTGWSDAQCTEFLLQQGRAQHHHYRLYYAEADYRVILVDGERAGRLYVARWPSEVRLMDIALLPAYRNHGIGTNLIVSLISEAARCGLPISAHVESFNPALRLYERLGFRMSELKGVNLLMVRAPEALTGAASKG